VTKVLIVTVTALAVEVVVFRHSCCHVVFVVVVVCLQSASRSPNVTNRHGISVSIVFRVKLVLHTTRMHSSNHPSILFDGFVSVVKCWSLFLSSL